jgi:hypothetical protein
VATGLASTTKCSFATPQPLWWLRRPPALRCPAAPLDGAAATHLGVCEEVLSCLRGPISINIGSNTSTEIAVSVMAELLAVKNGVDFPVDFSVAFAKRRLDTGVTEQPGLVCGIPNARCELWRRTYRTVCRLRRSSTSIPRTTAPIGRTRRLAVAGTHRGRKLEDDDLGPSEALGCCSRSRGTENIQFP